MPGRLVSKVWEFNPTLNAPARYQRACTYDAHLPDPLANLELALDGKVAGQVSEAEHAIRSLNDTGGPALRPLARLLLRTESIASSRVEGMQIGVRELARAEANTELGRKPGITATEIIANIDAMVLAIETASSVRTFGIAEITAIHRCLMERAENKHIAGRIREQQNWIGGNDYNPCGADFVPPPPAEVGRLLQDLCEAINDDSLPPLIQAGLVHAQFETIHPFDDGNGRTGRALIHVILRRRGLAPRYLPPVSVSLAANKDSYIRGLTAFRGTSVNAWIAYFAGATTNAALLARAYLDAVSSLVLFWRSNLEDQGAPRADAVSWDIVDLLPAHPIVTAPGIASLTGRAKNSVYQALELLQRAGVLVPVSKSKRNQVWEAAGLLELIEGLEAGRFPVQQGT